MKMKMKKVILISMRWNLQDSLKKKKMHNRKVRIREVAPTPAQLVVQVGQPNKLTQIMIIYHPRITVLPLKLIAAFQKKLWKAQIRTATLSGSNHPEVSGQVALKLMAQIGRIKCLIFFKMCYRYRMINFQSNSQV